MNAPARIAADAEPGPDLEAFDARMAGAGWALFPQAVGGAQVARLAADAERVYALRRALQLKNGVAAGLEGNAHHVLGEGTSLDDFIDDPPLMDVVTRFFGGGKTILLNFGAVINAARSRSYVLRPHRDVRAFSPGYRLSLNMLVMLDDFTRENGATLVLEGSHRTESAPDAEAFARDARPVTGRAGDVILFDSLLVHSGAPNHTPTPRRALTLCFGRPFMKPSMDWPRYLPAGTEARASAVGRQLLGYHARTPAGLDEFYQPAERWTFKPDQR